MAKKNDDYTLLIGRKDKRFYNGIELRTFGNKQLYCFKDVKTTPHATDIVTAYNTILNQAKEFFVQNQKLMGENLELYQELKQLKEQIIIYEKFLDGNDLDIEWDLFCTADICEEEEDMDCKYCKHMRWKE